ncbi:MAG: hypothetical protein AAGF11_52790 [Myxococcota bacterium]
MLFALGLALMSVDPAITPTPSVELQWIAPAHCPTEQEVAAQVEAWLARAIAPGPVVRAQATILPDDHGLVLQLRLETPDGTIEQSTASADCPPLAEATALQMAMAIDPEAVAAEAIARAEAKAAAQAPPAVEPSVEEQTPPGRTTLDPTPPPDPAQTRGAIWVEGSVGGGRVPRIDGRVGAGGSLLLPEIRVDLGAVYTIRQRRVHPDLESIALDLWQWGIVARGCGRPMLGPIELPVCGGAELGATVGRGDGVQRRRTARAVWLAALGSVGLSWSPWRWLAVGAAVQGYVALRRSPFTVDTLAPFFEPGVVGGAGLLRVEGRFL